MIIYKVTNLINGKVYIGQSQNTLEWRKSKHIYLAKNGCNYYFHNALRKYGIENFKWQVICICPNIKILNEQEEYYIAFYGSFGSGYNLTSGGLNCVVSEETKKKLKETQKGEKNGMFGKKHSPESIAKMRKAKLGRKHTPEAKEKCRQASLGRKHTEESKEKIRKANLGRTLSEESKQKMRGKRPSLSGKNNPMYGKRGEDSPNYGRKPSDEARKKMSKNSSKYWLGKKMSLETREKMCNSALNKPAVSNITKEKNKQAALDYWAKVRAGLIVRKKKND